MFHIVNHRVVIFRQNGLSNGQRFTINYTSFILLLLMENTVAIIISEATSQQMEAQSCALLLICKPLKSHQYLATIRSCLDKNLLRKCCITLRLFSDEEDIFSRHLTLTSGGISFRADLFINRIKS